MADDKAPLENDLGDLDTMTKDMDFDNEDDFLEDAQDEEDPMDFEDDMEDEFNDDEEPENDLLEESDEEPQEETADGGSIPTLAKDRKSQLCNLFNSFSRRSRRRSPRT